MARECDDCHRRMEPYVPRNRVGDQMLCAACTERPRGGMVSASSRSDDNLFAVSGVRHTSNGRWLGHRGRTASDLWRPPDPHIEPVRHVLEGANAYSRNLGLGESHSQDFARIQRSPASIRDVGKAYDALPDNDPAAHPAFHALRKEINHQYDHLTKRMGVHVEPVDEDPYADHREMAHDLATNKRIKVLRTSQTGGHPFLSDEDNDKFRAVHDAFGHAGTGRGFDRHGEEAAWTAHSGMFTPAARPALTSETRGQNSSLILNGKFAPQKVALLPKHMTHLPSERDEHTLMAKRRGLPENQKCKYCKEQATKRLLWAEGMAYIPVCDAHESQGRHRIEVTNNDEVVSVHPIKKDSMMNPKAAVLTKEGHDSGDGQTVYHCPFCGSGQVIARSDRTIECEFCHTCFTVQVQPEFSAFPQSIDGMPVTVPGMPGLQGVDPSGASDGITGPVSPDELDETGAMGAGGQPGDPSAADAEADDADDNPGEDNDNPFTGSLSSFDRAAKRFIASVDPSNRREAAALVKAARKQA